MREIPLTQGYITIVDDADYDFLMRWKWHAKADSHSNTVYALRNGPIVGDKRVASIRMHRQILGTLAGVKIDHRDGNGLNNCRYNLRVCTHGQNMQNQRPNRGGSSQFKGVSWHTQSRKWRAQINLSGNKKHLGSFISDVEAAAAYNEAAVKYFGEFSCLNKLSIGMRG